MSDYQDRREAARKAIEEEGAEAVLAEDMASLSGAPREVILDEIIPGCNALLGIYGYRYGWSGAQRGLSPTEEEYDKARELFIPVYAFVDLMDDIQPEPEQQRFLERVQNWDQGVTRNVFYSLNELKQKIKSTLRGRDLSPRYRAFLNKFLAGARGIVHLSFREIVETRLPVFDLLLHSPSSQFTAGVESFLIVIDGDLYDRQQISQSIHVWCEEVKRFFNTGFWKAKNASATFVIAVEDNPSHYSPEILQEDKRLFHSCSYKELMVNLNTKEVFERPKSLLSKPPMGDPVKKMISSIL